MSLGRAPGRTDLTKGQEGPAARAAAAATSLPGLDQLVGEGGEAPLQAASHARTPTRTDPAVGARTRTRAHAQPQSRPRWDPESRARGLAAELQRRPALAVRPGDAIPDASQCPRLYLRSPPPRDRRPVPRQPLRPSLPGSGAVPRGQEGSSLAAQIPATLGRETREVTTPGASPATRPALPRL